MRQTFDLELPDGRTLKLGERTLVVGVLNVTPDSFSDGGEHFSTGAAVDHALQLEADGADIIEVGGESTRPGAIVVNADDEVARVAPVLKAVTTRLKVPISIDTYKSSVARVAIDLGASIINDVSALRFDPEIATVAADLNAPLVLMHMRGEPSTMQKIDPSEDIFTDIMRDLGSAIDAALLRGVRREQIVIDPGIGFGKTLEQNLEIIRHLEEFASFQTPLMIGTSRKSFIGRITGRGEGDRVFGTAASVAIAITHGAHLVRVHDVKPIVEVVRIADAIANA